MSRLAKGDGIETVGIADVGRHLSGIDHFLDLALERPRRVELQRDAGRRLEGLADGVAVALLGLAAPVPHDDFIGGGFGVAGLQRLHDRRVLVLHLLGQRFAVLAAALTALSACNKDKHLPRVGSTWSTSAQRILCRANTACPRQ